VEKKTEHMPCSEKLKIRVKELTRMAQEKNLIKPHTEAFAKYPVEEEVHKGKKDYYFN
jgi:hypothetical protein